MPILQRIKQLQFDVTRGERISEEDVRQALNYDIQDYLASDRYRMNITFRNEVQTGVRTFIDSQYENFIIEYKKPSVTLGDDEEEQLLEYIEGQNDHNFWGILTNGKNINFYIYDYGTYGENGAYGWKLIKDEMNCGALDEAKFKYVCDCIAKRDHLILTKNNINGYLGISSNKELIKGIFNKINSRQISEKTRLLYKEWLKLFNLSEGDSYDETKQAEIIKFYSELLDTRINSIELIHKALFAIQTYYAIIVKMILYRIIIQKTRGENRTEAHLKDFFTKIENNQFYREYNILNLIDGDFFSWYLDEFTNEQYQVFYNLLSDVYTVESDGIELLCIKFYENIFPFWVRHAMGEYYTPAYLANEVVDNAINMHGGNNIKLLDPTCGSGVFLLSALEKPEVSSIYGVDINPLAVLTSKINYLINSSGIDREHPSPTEIPIYLGDSTYIPVEEVINGVNCYKYSLSTSLEEYERIDFVFSSDIVNERNFFNILDDIEAQIKLRNEDMALRIIGSHASFHFDELEEYYTHLVGTLIELEEQNLNSIWLKIIGNYLKSGAIKGVDVVVGNPPRVRWSNLPEVYKDLIKDNCRIEGVFSSDNNTGGVDLNISALIAYVTIRDRLAEDGVLGFLMPDSILFNKSFEGFRNMQFQDGRRFYLNKVVRWNDPRVRPFDPVTLDFCEFYFSYNSYDRIDVFEKRGNSEKLAFRNPNSFNNHYIIASEADYQEIYGVLGTNDLEFRSGVGLVKGGYYLLEFKERINDNTSRFYHYEIQNRRLCLSSRTVDLENEIVYPYIKSDSVNDGIITGTDYYCIFPFPYGEKDPYPLNTLRNQFPLFYAYFMRPDIQSAINTASSYNRRVQNTSYDAGVFRVGEYTYSDRFLVTRDNTKSMFSLVGKLETPWGERKQPIFDGHTNYVSRVDGEPLTEELGTRLLDVFLSEGVKLYIKNSSDSRSISSRLYNDIDISSALTD